jgi:hypothetical protein
MRQGWVRCGVAGMELCEVRCDGHLVGEGTASTRLEWTAPGWSDQVRQVSRRLAQEGWDPIR